MTAPKETPATMKLWTFGDADKYDITVDAVADTVRPGVTITLPPTICTDPDEAEIDLTWSQFEQLREVVNEMHSWLHGEGLTQKGGE